MKFKKNILLICGMTMALVISIVAVARDYTGKYITDNMPSAEASSFTPPLNLKEDSEKSSSKTISNIQEKIDNYTLSTVAEIIDIKDNIYVNMINSVDFFDSVEGAFTTTLAGIGETYVEYQTDIVNQMAIQQINNSTQNETSYFENSSFLVVDNNTKSYETIRCISQYDESTRQAAKADICLSYSTETMTIAGGQIVPEGRVWQDDTGTNCYLYRNNITNTDIASLSIFPQDLAFGFLSDTSNWEITGVEEYLGRNAIILSGDTNGSQYGINMNVDTFTMWIDIETGILLNFQGFDYNGDLTQYLVTEHISVNSSIGQLESIIANAEENVKNNYVAE